MTTVNALITSAMPEEMKPMRALVADWQIDEVKSPFGKVELAHRGRTSILLARSGVGMTAAAALTSWLLAKYHPRAIMSVGSAGGISADARVGQVVVGETYLNGGADATAFGQYVHGQVPGQPEAFPGGEDFVDAAKALVEDIEAGSATWSELVVGVPPTATHNPISEPGILRVGQMLSSDAFVTEANVMAKREIFNKSVTADMESAALAQVAHMWDIPFVSVRGISDLAGHPDDQSVRFHTELESVAQAAAFVAFELLRRTHYLDIQRSTHGPTQRFESPVLTAALFFAIAGSTGAEPGDINHLPPEMVEQLKPHLESFDENARQYILQQIAAGIDYVAEHPHASLTAKDYDHSRFDVLEHRTADTDRFLWPPTSQTIIKRFNGYWNDALSAIGLSSRRGRARGGLKFSEEDYIYAIRLYLVDQRRAGLPASFNGYTPWLDRTGNRGKLPSGAAIRQRFGAWREAMQAALEPSKS